MFAESAFFISAFGYTGVGPERVHASNELWARVWWTVSTTPSSFTTTV